MWRKVLSYSLIMLLFVLYLYYYDVRTSVAEVFESIVDIPNNSFIGKFLQTFFYKKISLGIWAGYVIYALTIIGLTVSAIHIYFGNKRYTQITIALMLGTLVVCGGLTFVLSGLGWQIADRICRETVYYVISPVSVMFLLPTFMLAEKEKASKTNR